MDISTKTARDAVARIRLAQTYSLSNAPSEEYLVTLRNELRKWLGNVEEKLDQKVTAEWFLSQAHSQG
jgi:hypothetical protein